MSVRESVESQTTQTTQTVGAACAVGLGWGAILAVTDVAFVSLVLSLVTPGEHSGATLLLLALLVLMPVVGALFAYGYRPAGRAELRREVRSHADLQTPATLTGLDRGVLDRRLTIAVADGLSAIVMVVLATELGLTAPVTVAVVLACWVVNTMIVKRLV